MTLSPDLIWKTYSEEFPELISTATREDVVREFHRRNYQTEKDLERFVAGIRFDRWYAADFTDGQPVGWHGSPRAKYVNAYEVDRMYGGPEEGGWYYDAGTPLASVPVDFDATESEIEAVEKSLRARFGIRSSSISIQDHFAEPFPQARPHFE